MDAKIKSNPLYNPLGTINPARKIKSEALIEIRINYGLMAQGQRYKKTRGILKRFENTSNKIKTNDWTQSAPLILLNLLLDNITKTCTLLISNKGKMVHRIKTNS